MAEAISAWQAASLLTRLKLRRQLNHLRAANPFGKSSGARTGTASKSSSRWLLAFIAVVMLGNVANLSHQGMVRLQRVLGSVEVYKEVRHGWLGVQLAPVTPEVADRLGIRPARGVLITGMTDGGPAKRGGLQSGDVILRADGKEIHGVSDGPRVVGAAQAGKTVEVISGRQQSLAVRVGTLPQDAKPSLRPVPPEPGSMLAPGVVRGATLLATLLLLSALMTTIGSREIARPEWDLEWLATLPLPLSVLLSSRLIERGLTNAASLITLGPFLSILAWECGCRWTAPLAGFALALALAFVVATFQTLVDTGLRMSVSPPRLRNLQAVMSLLGVLPLLLAAPIVFRDDAFAFRWAAALPDWMSFVPPGLAVRALSAADHGAAAAWSALMVGEIIALAGIGYTLLRWQLRNGVVAAGAREAVIRSPAAGRRPVADIPTAPVQLPAVARRELRLLARDRAFMVQTLVVPLIMLGMQFFIGAGTDMVSGAVDHPAHLATIAFGLAAYTLMLSAFQTLNAEGQALWILYCVPRSLGSILKQKTGLWAAVASIYAIIVFAVAAAAAGHVSWPFVGAAAIALLGVPIFAVIATALGVFGCDPLAQEVQRRVRPTYAYVYMVLASLYVYAFYATTILQRGAMMILTTLLATALWQKARDQFDYLLDPTASPPARVSVSDGLIAALIFFVLQAMVVIFFKASGSTAAPATVLWIAFCSAGAATYAAMRLVYWRARTTGVPRIFGDEVRRGLLWGAAGGVAAALAGLAYIQTARSMHLFPPLRNVEVPHGTTALWLAALVIVAAPLFEEFIFRGLIFGGLRRSLGLGAATLASAAIFAIVHPPVSVIPVFFMAVCAALIYERTRMLAAPMLVHAIYNAAVLGFQWNAMP
jgi:membrane protease YdiL (CAAX protease family)